MVLDAVTGMVTLAGAICAFGLWLVLGPRARGAGMMIPFLYAAALMWMLTWQGTVQVAGPRIANLDVDRFMALPLVSALNYAMALVALVPTLLVALIFSRAIAVASRGVWIVVAGAFCLLAFMGFFAPEPSLWGQVHAVLAAGVLIGGALIAWVATGQPKGRIA